MAFIPSIRECLDRAQALPSTAKVIADLDVLDRELRDPGEPSAFTEISQAITQLRTLNALVVDMAANMRNAGHAFTPAPPAPARLPAASVYEAPRAPARAADRTSLGDWGKAKPLAKPVAPAKQAAVERKPPPGCISTTEVMQRLGVSMNVWYALRRDTAHPTPRPVTRINRVCFYRIEAIDAYATATNARLVSEIAAGTRTGRRPAMSQAKPTARGDRT